MRNTSIFIQSTLFFFFFFTFYSFILTMFSRRVIRKFTSNQIFSNSNKSVQKSLLSTKAAATNQWVGPKLKRTLLYTSGIAAGGGLVYYLSTDRDRLIEVFGAHEHVHHLALHPSRGGAKNLPIISHQIDHAAEDQTKKTRLVIIGSGWGAVSVLKNLDKDKYDVTVVSENNYFLFTPLLPSGTVGTLELR